MSSSNQVSPRPSYRLLRFLHCESPTLLRSWKSAFKRSEKRAPKTRSGSKRPRTLSSPLDRPKLPGHRGLDQKMKTTSSSRCAGLIYLQLYNDRMSLETRLMVCPSSLNLSFHKPVPPSVPLSFRPSVGGPVHHLFTLELSHASFMPFCRFLTKFAHIK